MTIFNFISIPNHKIFLLKYCTILLCLLLTINYSKAQDIELNSQIDVDNFDSNITIINGDLTIETTDDDNPIVDLSNLSNITEVNEDLEIKSNHSLLNLDGLSSIHTINGELGIAFHNNLANIDGLSNLTSVQSIYFFSNAQILNLDAFANITSILTEIQIASNGSLSNLDGFLSLSQVNGDMYITDNNSLTNVNGLSNLTYLTGDLVFLGNDNLLNFDGLSNLTTIDGNLKLKDIDDPLVDLSGFNSLTTLGGELQIHNSSAIPNTDEFSNLTTLGGIYMLSNNGLISISGLNNITTISGRVEFYANDNLSDLSGLTNLNYIGGELTIRNTHNGSMYLTNLNDLSNLDSIGALRIHYYNSLTDISGLSNLTSIGELHLYRSALTDVDPLINITSLSGMSIGENATLNNLNGLANVTNIANDLSISGNLSLSLDVGIFPNLTHVGGDFNILNNNSLILDGFTSLLTVGGDFTLENNNNLLSVNGLVSLTTVTGDFIIRLNDVLNSIDGFSNLNSVGDLSVYSNYDLHDCCGVKYLITEGASNPNIEYNFTGCNNVDEILASFCEDSGVTGTIFHDIDENCIKDNTEASFSHRRAIIQPGDIIVETGATYNWIWHLDSLPVGDYSITIDTSGNWDSTCESTQFFSVTDADALTTAPSFGLISTDPCTDPDVSIHMPFLRRCFSDQRIYIEACNSYGTISILENPYVIVTLDSFITVNSATLPYTDLGNNMFQFDIDNLAPGTCQDIQLSTTISCDANLGQGLCVEAAMFPVENCVLDTIPNPFPPTVEPCTDEWDLSSLTVDGYCENDSIIFEITNTSNLGIGDMTCYSPVYIYINGNLIVTDSVQLLGGESAYFGFSGDGQSWHLQTEQHPQHPGDSHPNATIENCGGTAVASRINAFAHDDADPIIDIFCAEVTGSYDPNDKTGYPLGITEESLILPNRQMEYVIRFQNTGTDTAFTVVVRDTLEEDFDIFSVQPGTSSHDYDFTIYGPRILEWTFNNIMLPDSTTNEPESNGFLTFTVNQLPNLDNGTELNNNVGIYFDFNDPVITNTTSHIVDDMIQTANFTETTNVSLSDCDSIIYNDITYNESGTYYQFSDDNLTLNILEITIDEAIENLQVTDCQSYTSEIGNIYTESGLYEEIIQNSGNCDNIVRTIDLTIIDNTSESLEISTCEEYISPSGIAYTASGIYEDIIPNALGCDSIINIDLNIITIDNSVLIEGNDLLANQSSASYQWLDCDNANEAIPLANGQLFSPEESGNYAVQITTGECTAISDCHFVTTVSIEDFEKTNFNIFPNPNNGKFMIDLGKNYHEITIEMINVIGESISSKTYSNVQQLELETEVSSGVYFLKIHAANKKPFTSKLIIK